MIRTIKKIGKLLQRCFKSKTFVGFAILAFWGIGSVSNTATAEEEPFVFGATYQIYMLGTKAEEITNGSETQKVAILGNLGSGGVSGEFSYDDIVNSAKSEVNKETAKRFASMMATYSTFGYVSNKVQAFESIRHDIIRGILGLLLFIPAIVVDLLNMLIPQLIGMIAKYNVITFLAQAFGNTKLASGIAEATGLTSQQITSFVNAIFSFAVIAIILNIFGVFKQGSRNIDKRQVSRLKGRLVTLIALPLFVVAGANILDFTSELTGQDDALVAGSFSNYMVDVRSWAYNFNFAPRGDNAEASDISPSENSSYVDLDFNPYTTDGQQRIASINSKSSLIGTNQTFANSSLVLSYMKGQSFSALDYINYKGTKASQHYYNGVEDGSGGKTFGSYYSYANSLKDKLASEEPMTGSGEGSNLEKGDEKGSYQSAIEDYAVTTGEEKKDKKLTVSPQVAWRDRFIYGAKTSGKNVDKYYNESPSQEMIKTTVGATNNGNALTDQSMYLVLSTIFTETGGKYSIDAPARGIMQAKAKFDSNRSDYYVVSMVGNPIFTVAGLIAEPLILLVAVVALIFAILGIGFLDMNLLPMRAWVKGLTLGDMEYPQAFLVYALGIAGTVASMYAIPQLFVKTITFLSKAITIPADISGFEPTTPMGSLTAKGVPLLVSALIAVAIIIGCVKVPGFFEKIVALYTFIWSWAKEQGRLLERNAMGQAMRGAGVAGNQRDAVKPIQKFRNIAGKTFGNTGDDADDPPNESDGDGIPETKGAPDGGNHKSNSHEGDTKSISDFKNANNPFNDAEVALEDTALDGENSDEIQDYAHDAKNSLKKFKEEPTEENLQDVRRRLGDLRQQMIADGSDPEDIAKIDEALANVDSVAKDYELDTDGSKNDKSITSTPENTEGEVKDISEITPDEDIVLPESEADRNVKVSDNFSEGESVKPIGNPDDIPDSEGNRNIVTKDGILNGDIETDTFSDPTLEDAEISRNVKSSNNVLDGEEAKTIDDPTLKDAEALRNVKASNNVLDGEGAKKIDDPTLEDAETSRNVKTSNNVRVSGEFGTISDPTLPDADIDRKVNIKDRIGKEDRSLIRDSNNLKDEKRIIDKTIDRVNETHLNEKTINRTSESNLNKINRNERTISRNIESNSSKNIYVKNENYDRLINSLGKATSNSGIGKALSEVKTSQNDNELRKALLNLSKTYVNLDSSYKKGENDRNVLKTIGNMVKYNSKN